MSCDCMPHPCEYAAKHSVRRGFHAACRHAFGQAHIWHMTSLWVLTCVYWLADLCLLTCWIVSTGLLTCLFCQSYSTPALWLTCSRFTCSPTHLLAGLLTEPLIHPFSGPPTHSLSPPATDSLIMLWVRGQNRCCLCHSSSNVCMSIVHCWMVKRAEWW